MRGGEAKHFTCTHGLPPPPPPLLLFLLSHGSPPLPHPRCHPRHCTLAPMRLQGRSLWRRKWPIWIWQRSVIFGWIMTVGNPASTYEPGTDQQWPPPFPVNRGPFPRTEKARGEGEGGLMGQAHEPCLGWLHWSPRNWRRSTVLLDATWTVSISSFSYCIVKRNKSKK